MNVKAKQMQTIDVHNKMDIMTALSYFMQIKGIISTRTELVNVLGSVWTAFTGSIDGFDVAYAQVRRWLQTEDIGNLDKERDKALSAFLNALKAFVASPNATKREAARRVQYVRDKYHLATTDEYMKETYSISQIVTEYRSSASLLQDIELIGLTEYLDDLEAKNVAFLAKMNERTEAQAGIEKGIVREKRLIAEAALQDLTKLLNALAIVEYPAGVDYDEPIDLLNAEVEHYRRILAQKGISTGSGSSGSNGSNGNNGSNGTDEPVNPGNSGNSGGSGSGSGSGTGSGGDNGGGNSGGSGSGDNGGNSGGGGGGDDWGNGSDE